MISVIITAAGSSSRMGGQKKEYLPFGNGTVLSENAKKFLANINVDTLLITYSGEEAEAKSAFFSDKAVLSLCKNTETIFVTGGSSRRQSILNALEVLAEKSAEKPQSEHIVLVHDGARPFVTRETIRLVTDTVQRFGAAIPAVPCVDTLKEICPRSEGIFVARHLVRAQLAAVQTPQGFVFTKLLEAHRKAVTSGKEYTDDSEIWQDFCGDVCIVSGDVSNKKITYIEDTQLLKNKLAQNSTPQVSDKASHEIPNIKIGFGYDLHRLVAGRKLVLGGVELPFDKGEDGHSDGDVLLHAITDALLGASGIGDIGSFFPPDDEKWRGANSAMLLQTAWAEAQKLGWHIVNIDCVVKLEKPKFLPHREKVCESIATALGIDRANVFVKAKTGEQLGDVGSSNAIEAWATCLLFKA